MAGDDEIFPVFSSKAKGVMNYGLTHGDYYFDGKDLTDFIAGLKTTHLRVQFGFIKFEYYNHLSYSNPLLSHSDFIDMLVTTQASGMAVIGNEFKTLFDYQPSSSPESKALTDEFVISEMIDFVDNGIDRKVVLLYGMKFKYYYSLSFIETILLTIEIKLTGGNFQIDVTFYRKDLTDVTQSFTIAKSGNYLVITINVNFHPDSDTTMNERSMFFDLGVNADNGSVVQGTELLGSYFSNLGYVVW